MVHDIQFAVERMDNQQFEQNDFIDTSEEAKEPSRAPAIV
jgi:hypothetical protein